MEVLPSNQRGGDGSAWRTSADSVRPSGLWTDGGPSPFALPLFDQPFSFAWAITKSTSSWHSNHPVHMLCPCPLITLSVISPPNWRYRRANSAEFDSRGTTL